eukprot:CAMPEP_0176378028 /NCGR_PEP_ID=MMETSP0126-20121128/29322_1 /TAXON_ID=141414 ORGANISM="Strombidinopsis acuminatum, Strain SPMC142" /NCGR_SAMPLE_ID=MMETSP0126 /ASSEMBLY_ACC=CAM_ASM_000229 /LENGTH=181 /DNA_ID=CAMNT_0017740143 /DNA_START=118 /DNA_END=663 /DNA_ORIENTATION=-
MYMTEFAQRFSIDLGIPIVSVNQLYQNVVERTGKHPAYQHKFFHKVKDMIEAGDEDALVREKVPLKLLRLTETAQEGFLLMDFPQTINHATMLEEYKGGMNAFVHVDVDDKTLLDINANRVVCAHCNRNYLKNDIVDAQNNVYLSAFMPEDGKCYDCGSTDLRVQDSQSSVENQMNAAYKQ